jgi:hypothetical protein
MLLTRDATQRFNLLGRLTILLTSTVRESVRGKWNYRYVSLLMILFSDLVSTEKNLARPWQFALFLLHYCSKISI